MPDTSLLAQAAAGKSGPAPSELAATLQGGISDIERIPFLQHLNEVFPAADLVFGGGMLMLIVLIHAAGARVVTGHVARRSLLAMERPKIWRADLLMSSSVLMLLALHLTETFVWASALVYAGIVPGWRAAGFFAGNTYTTVGYGNFVLPAGWEMLAPIIAISGLFTFGWSGSVLVDIVMRCQRIKDAAVAKLLPAKAPRAPAE